MSEITVAAVQMKMSANPAENIAHAEDFGSEAFRIARWLGEEERFYPLSSKLFKSRKLILVVLKRMPLPNWLSLFATTKRQAKRW